jgi:acyl-CoA synthetase (AMP-forming)/AMP-acid ligase II
MEELDIQIKNLNQTALIRIKPNKSREVIKYKELLKEIIKTQLAIEEFEVNSSVGIQLKKSFALIAITFGVLEANLPFCYIDNSDDLQAELIDFNSRYIFTEHKIDLPNFKLLKTLTVCGQHNIYFYKLDIVRNLQHFDDPTYKLCYAIKTSGTSGRKKIVHVTYKSICSNQLALQRIFQLTPNDIILSMSPITFDPFIVDLFLAFKAGCSLLFVDNSLRFDPFVFERNDSESTGVTFLQMTPTLFQQFGIDNIQKRILSDDSSLK